MKNGIGFAFDKSNRLKERIKTEHHKENNQPIEKENGDNTQWRPTDGKTEEHSENPTGMADKSPAEQTGDLDRTPGKAEGEDFEEK